MSASKPGPSNGGSVVRHLCCQLQDVHSQHIDCPHVEWGRAGQVCKVLHQYAIEDLHVTEHCAVSEAEPAGLAKCCHKYAFGDVHVMQQEAETPNNQEQHGTSLRGPPKAYNADVSHTYLAGWGPLGVEAESGREIDGKSKQQCCRRCKMVCIGLTSPLTHLATTQG